jgi:hypothetical protein
MCARLPTRKLAFLLEIYAEAAISRPQECGQDGQIADWPTISHAIAVDAAR